MGIRSFKENVVEHGQDVTWPASDLLRSPLVAKRPQLIRMRGTDLVQRSQVSGQVCPKVLSGFREIRDVLQAQQTLLAKEYGRSDNQKYNQPFTHPQFI